MNAGAAGRNITSHHHEKNVSATGASLPEDGELAAQLMNRERGDDGPSVAQRRCAAPVASQFASGYSKQANRLTVDRNIRPCDTVAAFLLPVEL